GLCVGRSCLEPIMSNDVKDRGLTGAILDALWPILGGSHTAASVWTEIDNAVSDVIARHQPQREAVLEAGDIEWLRKELFAAKLLASHQSQKRIERILAALTTPAPAAQPQRDAILEEAARVAYVTCAKTRHVRLGTECEQAIRALKATPAPAAEREAVEPVAWAPTSFRGEGYVYRRKEDAETRTGPATPLY